MKRNYKRLNTSKIKRSGYRSGYRGRYKRYSERLLSKRRSTKINYNR